MSGLHPNVELLCWIAVATTATNTAALLYGILWCVRYYYSKGQIRSWSRFQNLSVVACIAGAAVCITSMVELIAVMYIAPERLSSTAGNEKFETRKGVPMIAVSGIELFGQILLPITVLCYSLVLLERLSAFRFLLPTRHFRLIYSIVFVSGGILFLLTESCNILVNVLPLSDPIVTALNVMGNSLIIESLLLEWTLSFVLIRKFFTASLSNTNLSPWTLSDRVVQRQLNHSSSMALQEVNRSEQSNDTIAIQNEPSAASSQTPQRLVAPVQTTQPQSPVNPTPANTEPLFQSIAKNPHKRRTLFLFMGIILIDIMGVLFYALALSPDSGQNSRPLEIIGRTAVVHIVLALIFLDSFKHMLHGSDISTIADTSSLPISWVR
ncbi:hypothetical protein BJ742DRAFT_789417 [Cladochytrium replicatum]|nr:hypothetical protein BJ742DRAFT_789417 [Cladochytrium replicatum]